MNEIKATNILVGKGVKGLGWWCGWYHYLVTDEALMKIKAKGINFKYEAN